MKTEPGILKLLALLCSAFATTAVFGQTTFTWTGDGDGTNFYGVGNWTPSNSFSYYPIDCFGDTAQWDGVTTSNLLISYNTGPIVEFCGSGINLVLTSNQANSVQIVSPVAQSSILRVFGITIDGPSGQLIVGGGNPANEFITVSRPSGATHDWINNSTNPAVIAPNVAFQAGGGAVYTIGFDGSGDWRVTNSLANANNTGILLTKLGPGTWYWNGPTTPSLPLQPNGTINSPLALSGGTVVLQWANPRINNVAIQNNGTLLEYDAPSQAQTLNGVISGTGLLQVNNGTLTLAGQNTYSANILLTGGELIVAGAENPGVSGPLGLGGTISFNGGTLGFSVNNTFDYSPRFSTAAGQAYKIDTGGLPVTFATGLTSSGGTLTKLGAGALTLTATSSYGGTTTVSAGKLVFQGPKPGTGNITVADGAALGVTATGTQVKPGTLTVGASSGCTLEFNNLNSTTTAPLAAGTLSSFGTVTININSGMFTAGQSYPLLAWASGSAPGVSLGILNGAGGHLSISGNTLYLNITSVVYTWTGAANGTNLGTAANWSPVGQPSGASQDTAQWDGVTTSNLLISYTAVGLPGTGFNTLGINLVLTPRQTNSVQISSTVFVSAALAVFGITNNSPNAGFTLGDTNWPATTLDIYARPAGAVHHLVNNSTNPVTINPSVVFQAGGGNGYTYDFGGTGNWIINNYLIPYDGAFSASFIRIEGPGTVFWSAAGNPPNSPLGGITINGGSLVIKSSGLFPSPANQPITNDATFVFDAASQTQSFGGVISGSGQLIVNNGTLTLAGANTYTGPTAVSNGTLFINGGNVAASTSVNGGTLGGTGTLSGPVSLYAGSTLAPGASAGSVGTLTINSNLTIGGNLAIEVNKLLAPSNDFVFVTGVLTNSGTGTLTVANLGPPLAAGDKFTLFSQPLQNGGALTVTGAGATWANHLAADGSISVTSITRPTLNFTPTGNSLQFSWNTGLGAFRLQAQTNSINVGLSNNWADYPGGGASPVTVPMDAMQDTVFFRLVSTP